MNDQVDDKIALALDNFDGGQGEVNIEENEAFLELQDAVEELRQNVTDVQKIGDGIDQKIENKFTYLNMLITSTEKELIVSIDKSKKEMMDYSQGIKDKFEAELKKRQRRESDFQV